VIEGDIRGCFDNISHEHILITLKSWGVKRNIVEIIERMLKSKVLFKDMIQNVDTGTPQGGTLSPMLANVALTLMTSAIRASERTRHVQRSVAETTSKTLW